MKQLKRHTLVIPMLAFALGFSACQKNNENKIRPLNKNEILIQITKWDSVKKNSYTLPKIDPAWNNIFASDFFSFDLKKQTTKDPLQLYWRTKCQKNEKHFTLEGMHPIPNSVRVSEFLPHELFFDPQDKYPKDIQCSFDFTAKQENTQATHLIHYESPVYLDSDGRIGVFQLEKNEPITELNELTTITHEHLNRNRFLFPKDHLLQLHCFHFSAPIKQKDPLSLELGPPAWINDKGKTLDPLHEFPLQTCRVLGKNKEGFISSWSPYFIFRTEPGPLQIDWNSSPKVNRYILDEPFPLMDLGTLSVENPHAYPQIISVPKTTEFELHPLLFMPDQDFRPNILVRTANGSIMPPENYRLLQEQSDHWIIQLAPYKNLKVVYQSQVDIHCYIFPLTKRYEFRMLNREGGFFTRLREKNSPTVAIMVENPIRQQEQIVFRYWQRETAFPFSWVTAIRPPKAQDYVEKVGQEDMLRLPIGHRFDICR